MSDEREEAIAAVMARTGKTREQTEAFLAILGSAFRRRGWVEGEPDPEEVTARNVDIFLSAPIPGSPEGGTK